MFWPFSTISRLRRENQRLEDDYKDLKTRYGFLLERERAHREERRAVEQQLDEALMEIRSLRGAADYRKDREGLPVITSADPILPQKKVKIDTEPKRTYDSVRSSDDSVALAVTAAVTAAVIASDGAEAAIRVVEPTPAPAPSPQSDYSGGGGDTGGGGASASFSTD